MPARATGAVSADSFESFLACRCEVGAAYVNGDAGPPDGIVTTSDPATLPATRSPRPSSATAAEPTPMRLRITEGFRLEDGERKLVASPRRPPRDVTPIR